jgi:hypothetical protein
VTAGADDTARRGAPEARYDPRVTLFSRRLPAVVTRADLAWLVTPTYAEALSVEDDEAHDRLERALLHPELVDDLLWGISEALPARQGARTTEDQLVDRLSKALHARRGKVTAAAAGPSISAVLVRINVELGLAPEPMRATLRTDKGQALLDDGLRKLGAHLVNELLK